MALDEAATRRRYETERTGVPGVVDDRSVSHEEDRRSGLSQRVHARAVDALHAHASPGEPAPARGTDRDILGSVRPDLSVRRDVSPFAAREAGPSICHRRPEPGLARDTDDHAEPDVWLELRDWHRVTTLLVLPAGGYGDSGIANVEPPSSRTSFRGPVGTCARGTTFSPTAPGATSCRGYRRPAVGA